MNYRRGLLAAVFLVVVFLFTLGSYLAGWSTIAPLEGAHRNRGSLRVKLQHRNLNVAGDQGITYSDDRTVGNTDSHLQQVIEELRQNIDQIEAKATNSQQGPVSRLVSSKVQAARQLELIKKVIGLMDDDLRVQYYEQVGRYEAEHSESFSQLQAARQWEFMVRFMEVSGHTQRLPDVINIGVKKSGTNAMGFFVSQHPLITHSLGNEVHFFDWNYRRGLEYYRSRMGFASKYQLSFEKTPRYFVTESAPRDILKDLGNQTKFILCLRDPIDRMKSDFRHERELFLRRKGAMQRGKKPPESSPEVEGKMLTALILDADGNVNASQDAVRTSSYSKHLRNWLQYYPINNFLLVDHDALNEDTFTVLEEVEQFLQLHTYFKPSMFYYDSVRHGACIFNPERVCPPKSSPGLIPKAMLSREVEEKLRVYFGDVLRELVEMTGVRYSWMERYL